MKNVIVKSLSLLTLFAFSMAQADVMLVDSITTGGNNSNTSSYTFSSTGYSVAETGNNNMLVVFYSAYGEGGGSDPTLTSASFGGVNLNIAASATAYDGFEATTSILYMKESDFASISGSDLVFTRSGASNGDRGVQYGIMTLSGVDQSTPIGDFGGDSADFDPTPISVELTGLSSGGLIISSFTGNAADNASSIGSLVNVDATLATLNNNLLSSLFGSTDITGTSETVGATFTADYSGDRSAMVSVEFIAIPEPSSLLMMLSAVMAGVLVFRRRN